MIADHTFLLEWFPEFPLLFEFSVKKQVVYEREFNSFKFKIQKFKRGKKAGIFFIIERIRPVS